MPRATWLADVLRAANLKVVEISGWEARGSDTFQPLGVTWHATAGSRTSTAMGEVHVILTGSATAPAPISQLMIDRDGTIYLCAAGRCNHNKVGWDGPNQGLGNTQLFGIEMANDNRGEPWPEAQLDAARRATAAIMRRIGADPLKRLAAHYEHQPYATRPPGEGSTKSDPYGVDMTDERPRVAALMTEDDVTKTEFTTWMTEWASSKAGKQALALAVLGFDPGRDPKTGSTWPGVSDETYPQVPAANGTVAPGTALGTLLARQAAQTQVLSALASKDMVDEQAVAQALAPLIMASLPAGTTVTQDVLEAALRGVFSSVGQ